MQGREIYSILWWNNLKERKNLDDLGVDGNISWILNLGWEFLNWINLIHDRDQCGTLVNTVMTLEIPHATGNIVTTWATIRFSDS
jgi:hypothetical protein